MVSPILVALDTPDLRTARRLAGEVAEHVAGFKVGLELLMGEGPRAIDEIALLGLPVFADVKLHDIPNTVERAAGRLAERGARWITVHGTGGRRMIEAAVAAADDAGDRCGILVVSVLTSMEEADLEEAGLVRSVPDQVRAITQLAGLSGAEGMVCSPAEVEIVKGVHPSMLCVTPGVRPRGVEAHDQKRVATPEAALAAGADLLVIGRPITAAQSPAEAAAIISAAVAAR